jgi:hypothetical protein
LKVLEEQNEKEEEQEQESFAEASFSVTADIFSEEHLVRRRWLSY